MVALHQAFSSEYPVDMYDFITKVTAPKPEWNWTSTYCEIGDDPIIEARRVEDLQLDTGSDVAGVFAWTARPVPPRPQLT